MLKNVSLRDRVRLAIGIVTVFAIILSAAIFVVAFSQLLNVISTDRQETEVQILQQQLVLAEQTTLQGTKILVLEPLLRELIGQGDAGAIRGYVVPRLVQVDLTSVVLVDVATDQRINSGLNFAGTPGEEDLLASARAGSETTALLLTEDQDLLIAASLPVRNETGEIVAVAIGAKAVDRAFLGDLILNRSSLAVQLLYDGTSLTRFSAEPETLGLLDQTMIGSTDDEAVVITQGFTRVEGRAISEAFVPFAISSGETVGTLHLVIEYPLVGQIQQAAIIGIFIPFIVIGIVLLGAANRVFTQDVLEPLNTVEQAAETMTQGQYDHRVPIHHEDEIGVLGHAFNTMAQAIQKREAELVSLNASLEQRVDERTRELQTQATALDLARLEAETANRLKSEFLATMSHELRTPLNAILGYSDILIMGMGVELDDKGRGMVERVHDNASELLELINDLLDMSKIEAGRMGVSKKPLELTPFFEGMFDQLDSLKKPGVALSLQLDPDLPSKLVTDEGHLRRIISNLLSNALKFTEAGNIDLIVKAEGAAWQIQVRDTGKGIAPHALPIIFEAFRQEDGSSVRAHGGTGLGLAITKRLVEALDGKIAVESTLGEGSTFTVYFPLEEPNHA
ncbi:MAG: HAMP domain-containing protein [Chloroflexi bacterium]|nr:HAMP domain-containing protein [Chloroflexota bacterium]